MGRYAGFRINCISLENQIHLRIHVLVKAYYSFYKQPFCLALRLKIINNSAIIKQLTILGQSKVATELAMVSKTWN